MKTIIALATILLLSFSSSFAQNSTQKDQPNNYSYNNYVGLQAGLHIVAKYSTDFPLISTIGINYQRQVYKKFHAELSYMMWMPSNWLWLGYEYGLWVTEIPDGTSYKVGQLVASEDFKMIDVSGLYSFLKPSSKHSLIAGLGITRYWGYNYHIEFIKIYNSASYERDERVKESFWGICPQISYRYSFLSKRISVGLAYKYRYIYHPKMNAETNYLITLGYNF